MKPRHSRASIHTLNQGKRTYNGGVIALNAKISYIEAIHIVNEWTIPFLTLLPITPPGLPKVLQDAARAAFA